MRTYVLPYRFTDNTKAMVAFIEALGLVREVTAGDDAFAIMRADAGEIGIHPSRTSETGAPPRETQFVLGTDDIDEFAALMKAAGRDIHVWDESYGRHAGFADGLGATIWCDERQVDLYGYQGHEGTPRPGLSVTAVRYSPSFTDDEALFGAVGFLPIGVGDDWWQALQADAHSGRIGLHKPTPGVELTRPSDGPHGDISLCQLGFTTTESLDELAGRLTTAGYPAEVVDQDGVSVVVVTDPDGCRIEIHSDQD